MLFCRLRWSAVYIKQKSTVMFRNHGLFGYITDNRNFGYTKNNDQGVIGDKILSESGAIFFSVLEMIPQHIDFVVEKIWSCFQDIDIYTVKNDAIDFYSMLERDGFVIFGETIEECHAKDMKFSYKILGKEGVKNKSMQNFVHHERDTQSFLEDHFEGKPQITNLHLEITSNCNERCVHCYIPHGSKVNNMDSDLFYDILEQCRDMKVLHLTLSGGEPMLHKDFCNFLRKCREYNFSVNVLSNLTVINDEILEEMKINPLLGVQTSLYSMIPDVHDEITRIKGSFQKTKNAILKLIESDIPLQISCPIMMQNKKSYNDVVRWAEDHGVYAGDDYVIIASYNNTNENLSSRITIDDVGEIINDKIMSHDKYFEKLEVEAEHKKNIIGNDFVCSVCNSSVCIAENGNVYPCAGWQGYVVGNVKDSSLKYIWENSEKIKYLRMLRKSDFPKCMQCEDKDYCTMCMVRNANENPSGDPLVVNEYFCDIARINKKATQEWRKKYNVSAW